jgi:hypothetical protein
MAMPLQTGRIEHVLARGKGAGMLEWKARILTLLITVSFVTGRLGELVNNWNW